MEELKMGKQFLCNGVTFSYADMVTANEHDAGVCAWLEHAMVGDIYHAGMGCDVERIA
jgi:hypothetical protein